MAPNLLDNPLIISMLFYPRPASPGRYPSPTAPLQADIQDGTIPVNEGIALGYRLYLHALPETPLLVYFHGNGEIAPDYDDLAPLYHQAGVSLLVVDYRGYGWSTGRPLVSTLLPDAEAVCAAVPGILEKVGRPGVPLFVKGRSLGSAPAIHLAYTYPERFRGLIVESGFADVPSLLMRLGLSLAALAGADLDVTGNARKMRDVRLPLLVIHGERDTLLPIENGQKLYDASPSQHKEFLRIPNGGHNNLLFVGLDEYFAAVRQFVTAFQHG